LTSSYALTASHILGASVSGQVATAATASFYLETDTLDSVVARGSVTTGSITVAEVTASGFSAAGHYIPTDDSVYDIGTADKQVRDIYVSTGSIIFGGTHRIEVNKDTNTFNFDAPAAEGLTIPCVDHINGHDYQDGTLLYDKESQKFKFRQQGLWAELGSGTGGGGNISVAGIGSGILTMADDADGPNRALLEEYTNNPVAYSGKTLYLAAVAGPGYGPFSIGSKFYFNEGGVWHPSHFFSLDSQESTDVPETFPDMQDILSLDATRTEDRAVLSGLHLNATSYGGRAIYLSNTGSVAIGDFIHGNKYYFNEGGTWFASTFHAEPGDE